MAGLPPLNPPVNTTTIYYQKIVLKPANSVVRLLRINQAVQSVRINYSVCDLGLLCE